MKKNKVQTAFDALVAARSGRERERLLQLSTIQAAVDEAMEAVNSSPYLTVDVEVRGVFTVPNSYKYVAHGDRVTVHVRRVNGRLDPIQISAWRGYAQRRSHGGGYRTVVDVRPQY